MGGASDLTDIPPPNNLHTCGRQSAAKMARYIYRTDDISRPIHVSGTCRCIRCKFRQCRPARRKTKTE
jgi:hypothetical protein